MSFWQWSTTASSNQTIDNTINYAEGQAPSTLNDAGRAVMAVLAAWRIDTSSFGQTTGGPTAFSFQTQAFSLLSQQTPSTPYTNMGITFTFNVQPSGTPTLAVDSGTAYPIQLAGATPPSGSFVTNVPYSFFFNGSAWQGINYYPTPFTGAVSTGQLPANQIIRQVSAAKDGGGAVVSTGLVFYFYIPFQFTPTSWWVVGDGQTGSCVIDFQTSGGSSQCGGNRPTISSNTQAGPSACTGWTSPITVGLYQWQIVSLSVFTKVSFGFYGNAT